MLDPIDFRYEQLSGQGTGSHDLDKDTIRVVYPFDRYEITLELTPDGRLLRILEVSVNKEFLDHIQRLGVIRSTGYFDTDEYYYETEDE